MTLPTEALLINLVHTVLCSDTQCFLSSDRYYKIPFQQSLVWLFLENPRAL